MTDLKNHKSKPPKKKKRRLQKIEKETNLDETPNA